MEGRGLRKLQSLTRSWLPKKTEDACVVLVGGESKDGNNRMILRRDANHSPELLLSTDTCLS